MQADYSECCPTVIMSFWAVAENEPCLRELAKVTVPFVFNTRSDRAYRGLFDTTDYERVGAYFEGIAETPLRSLSNLATELGLGALLVKDESDRAGLPAFKVLGASYAMGQLMETGVLRPGAVVACASTGNHGRAVARVAREHDIRAIVYLPAETIAARVEAIRSEGASVITIAGSYEDAVRQLQRDATRSGWTIISDTSWPGYEEIPRWIMAGYSKLLAETESQLSGLCPDVVLVQAGVGGLAGGLGSWLSWRYGPQRPFFIACISAAAPCLLDSIRAGRPMISRAGITRMTGLLCQELSYVAWPALSATIDAVVMVEDQQTTEAARLLAHPAGNDPLVEAGPSGACGLGALLSILKEDPLTPVARAARLGRHCRVLLLVTEGMTDPTF